MTLVTPIRPGRRLTEAEIALRYLRYARITLRDAVKAEAAGKHESALTKAKFAARLIERFLGGAG